jgi:photosystem II stability/assembly factor-like uncharacterized protein
MLPVNHLTISIRWVSVGGALAAFLLFLPPGRQNQASWQILSSGSTASLRGLSVVDDRVVWVSGTRGAVLHSTDGGASWSVDSIPGAGALDLRAIHGRSGTVAHVAATAGRIWRTVDGGRNWSLRHQATDTSVFLDAIVFGDDRFGIALGDPLDGRFLILVTRDGGDTWHEAPAASRPEARTGEAAFAASGTSLVLNGRFAWLGTGGSQARVLRSEDYGTTWAAVPSHLAAREGSAGVFSVAFADSARGIAVGGDYLLPDSTQGTAAFTGDGGRSWQPAVTPPRGYRSGAAVVAGNGRVVAVSVGTNGSDLSLDGGRTWTPLDATAFNAIQFAPAGIAFAAGARGRIARLDLRRHLATPR